MKKLLVLFLLLFVVACSNDDTSELVEVDEQGQEDVEKEEDTNKEVEDSESRDNRSEEEVEHEGELIEIGQVTQDGNSTVELLNIAEVNDKIEVGPLEIDVVNAKIIKMSEMSEDLKYLMDHYISMEDREELDYIQLRLDVENTSDQDISWDGISDLVTDKKEQIDGIKREFLSEANNKYLGNVKKELAFGFIVDDPDINNLRILFNRIYKDNFEELESPFEYEIEFD